MQRMPCNWEERLLEGIDQELGVASGFVVAPQFCFMPDQII